MAGFDLSKTKSLTRSFLQTLGLWRLTYVDPYEAMNSIDVGFSTQVPRGCHAMTIHEDGRLLVRLHTRGCPMTIESNGGHECSHVVFIWHGIPPRHHEPTTQRASLLVRMPEPGIETAIANGIDPADLGARYPKVYPSEIYLRIGLHMGAFVFKAGVKSLGREVANDTKPPYPREMLANSLWESAKATGRLVVGTDGSFALPYEDPGQRRGIMVVVRPK
jgi:hypothetical protein